MYQTASVMSASKSGVFTTNKTKNSLALKTQQSNQIKKEINFSDITPELAAKIVKHMVLPMFDNKFKRESKGS